MHFIFQDFLVNRKFKRTEFILKSFVTLYMSLLSLLINLMHPYGKVYIYIFPPKKILTDLKLSSLSLEGDTDFSQNISITLIFD